MNHPERPPCSQCGSYISLEYVSAQSRLGAGGGGVGKMNLWRCRDCPHVPVRCRGGRLWSVMDTRQGFAGCKSNADAVRSRLGAGAVNRGKRLLVAKKE